MVRITESIKAKINYLITCNVSSVLKRDSLKFGPYGCNSNAIDPELKRLTNDD